MISNPVIHKLSENENEDEDEDEGEDEGEGENDKMLDTLYNLRTQDKEHPGLTCPNHKIQSPKHL